MRTTSNEQGIITGVHPVPMSEIAEEMLSKVVSYRPDLSHILEQGPESLVSVENGELLSINTAIAVFAEALYSAQLTIAALINNWDISTATGYLLDHVGTTFFGLERNKAEPSEATFILVGNRGTAEYKLNSPPVLTVPARFMVSVSGRKFLTKYEQKFTSTFDPSTTTVVLNGVRYIEFKIITATSTRINTRFDVDNNSFSTRAANHDVAYRILASQIQKLNVWSTLANRSVAKNDVLSSVKTVSGVNIITFSFNEPVTITIPNTSTNRLSVLRYGIEFQCREEEDDVEGLISAGTEVDTISLNENYKLTTSGSSSQGKIDMAFLWSDSTRIVQRETDEEYRERLLSSRIMTSIGSPESIRSHILKIPGVTHCYVINNPTGTDRKIGPPPDQQRVSVEEDVDALTTPENTTKVPKFTIASYSFCVFVKGGSPIAVANTIYNLTPVGIPSSGHRYVDLTATNGEIVRVKFARPIPHSISVRVRLQKRKLGVESQFYQPDSATVSSLVKSLITERVGNLKIGELLKVQELGDDFFIKMPWLGYWIIHVADKPNIRTASSSEFKEEKQLAIQPYEFFSVNTSDIVIESISL